MSEAPRLLPNGDIEIVHARLCTPQSPTTHTLDPFAKYHPDQPRDDHGRWTDTNVAISDRTIPTGGSTTTLHGRAITSGKAFSMYPEHSRVYKRKLNRTALAAAVERYRRDKKTVLSESDNRLGIWIDESTGYTWLDVAKVVDTRREASRIARQHNQIAYFDLDTMEEVNVGGTGLSKRLRGWLDGRRGSGTPEAFDPLGLGRHVGGDRRGDDRGRVEALDPFGLSKRFDPSQPRHPKGDPRGGQWASASGDRIAPHYQQPYETPTGRGGAPRNFDATRMSSMTPEFLADMQRRFAEAGIDDITGKSTDLSRNLDELMKRIKAEHPDLVAIGEHWYQNAQDRIAEHAAESGVDLDTAIGMTAAMSPNSEWGQNIALAGEMMRQLKADKPVTLNNCDMEWLTTKAKSPRSTQYATFLDRMESGETPRLSELSDLEAAVAIQAVGRRRQLVSENPTLKGTFGKVAFATGTVNMAKAIAIYRGASIDATLGGHKVRSFYNNLSDPYDSRGVGDVTIDTHAASAAQQFRMPMTSKRADLTVWGGASTSTNQQGAYPVYADAYRTVAAKHGMTANQAQAVIWIGWQAVRHEYPGIVVTEDAKTLASGLKQADVYGPARQSTIGRYHVQTGASGVISPPRYSSQVSQWQKYQDGLIDWAEYAQYVARIPGEG